MAIEDLFDHKCDIYHCLESNDSPGYGLPGSPKFSYPDTPDLVDVPCHFAVSNAYINISQGEPKNHYTGQIKLTLPKGTDIRLNDKIVDKTIDAATGEVKGYEYTAEIPRDIRGHHIAVYLHRTDVQVPL